MKVNKEGSESKNTHTPPTWLSMWESQLPLARGGHRQTWLSMRESQLPWPEEAITRTGPRRTHAQSPRRFEHLESSGADRSGFGTGLHSLSVHDTMFVLKKKAVFMAVLEAKARCFPKSLGEGSLGASASAHPSHTKTRDLSRSSSLPLQC